MAKRVKIEKSEKVPRRIFNLHSLVLLIIFLILPLLFFTLRLMVIGEPFGFPEILFSLLFALIASGFLVWLKSFMMNNAYLGAVIGLVAIAVAVYALFLKYTGLFTTIFAIVISLLLLIYIGNYFIKSLQIKRKAQEDYYEDNPTS